MLHNFGKIDKSSKSNDKSFILRFIHEDLHNTFVTFKIEASSLAFVYKVWVAIAYFIIIAVLVLTAFSLNYVIAVEKDASLTHMLLTLLHLKAKERL